MAKKLHWTQTPEGRAKQSARMKKDWKQGVFNNKWKRGSKRAALKKKTTTKKRTYKWRSHAPEAQDAQVAYVCGRVEEVIAAASRSSGVAYTTLAARVAEILGSQTSR